MRLYEMLVILNENLPLLHDDPQGVTLADRSDGRQFLAGERIRSALRELQKVPALAARAGRVLALPAVTERRDAIVASIKEFQTLQALLEDLQNAGTILQASLREVTRDPSDLSVSILVPGDIRTLKDLSSFANDLETIFDNLSQRAGAGPVTFIGFETGTDWVTLAAGLPFSLAVILVITSKAIQYTKAKLAKFRAVTELPESVQKAATDAIVAQLREVAVAYGASSVEDLEKRGYTVESRNEMAAASTASVVLLAGLLERGTKVVPVLGTKQNKEQSADSKEADELAQLVDTAKAIKCLGPG